MKCRRRRDSQKQPLVPPGRHPQKAIVHRDGRCCLQHLHRDQRRQRHALCVPEGRSRGGQKIVCRRTQRDEAIEQSSVPSCRSENVTRILRYQGCDRLLQVRQLEVIPRGARSPTRQLEQAHAMPHVPRGEGADGGDAHVQSGEHVSRQEPLRQDWRVAASGLARHGIRVRWVEAKRCRRRAVGHEVYPQQVQRRQGFWKSNLWQAHPAKSKAVSLRSARAGKLSVVLLTYQSGEENRGDLADVAADEEADEALHVVIDAAAFLDGRDNRRKVVVGKNHVGSLLRYFGSRHAHRDADGCLLQCRRIVHAVPRHRGDLAHVRKHLHEPLLVARLRAAEDDVLALAEDALLLGLRQLEEVGSNEGLVRDILELLKDANVARDGGRRVLRVARDDDDADAGLLAALDGRLDLGSGGVLDSNHTDEGQVRLDVGELGRVPKRGRQIAILHLSVPLAQRAHLLPLLHGHGQAAQGPHGQLFVLQANLLLERRGQRHNLPGRQHDALAALEQHLRSALDEQAVEASILRLHDDAHALAIAVELQSGQAIELGVPVLVRAVAGVGGAVRLGDARGAQLLHERLQRRLRRLSDAVEDAVGPENELRIIAEGNACSEVLQPFVPAARAEVDAGDVAPRVVAGRLDLVLGHGLLFPTGDGVLEVDERHGSHLVRREGAGLVGADHRGAAQGLDAGEAAHDHVPLRHPARSQAEAKGDHRGESFGDGGDAQRHGNLGVVQSAHQRRRKDGRPKLGGRDGPDGDADAPDDLRELVAELVELLPQGRFLLIELGFRDSGLDPADLGAHSRRSDDGLGLAAGDHGAAEDDVLLPLDRDRAFHGVRRLRHRRGLAREGTLVARHRGGEQFDNAGVGRDLVAHHEIDDVARHQLRGRRIVDDLAVSQHVARRRLQLLEGVQAILRAELLPDAHEGVEHEDEQDHHRLQPRVLVVLHDRHDATEHRHSQQDLNQPILGHG
eukprot:scaffold7439_cov286-Pinguiococcus_pyrenoidosus.AAC.1